MPAKLHLVVLFCFLGVMSVYLILTVTNRVRLRRVLLTWPTGPLFGLPLLPVFFLAATGGLLAYTLLRGDHLSPVLLFGYMTGGFFWLVAQTLARCVVVTQRGLVRRVNASGGMLSWRQIADYVVHAPRPTERSTARQYTFFYADDASARQRVEVRVPSHVHAQFERIVEAKLDRRFEWAARRAFGHQAVNE